MTLINIPLEDFPSLDLSRKTRWAPILCQPKEASWEKFVVGIVAIEGDDFHIEVANRLSRLGCLYDERAMPIALAIEIAMGWLEEVISEGNTALSEIAFPVSNVSLGDCQVASGIKCKEVAQQWMGSLSSFYEPFSDDEKSHNLETVSEAIESIAARPLRLPVQVLTVIEKHDISLLEYFHEDVRNRSTRRARANARVKIDYNGRRLSANIDRFNIDLPSATVGQLKQRMWDLAIQRDRSIGTPQSHKVFEMLVDFPGHRLLDKRQSSVERIQEHLKELTKQADREEIRLQTLSGAHEIGKHILKMETA